VIVPLVVALALVAPAAPKKNTWVALVNTEPAYASWREELQKAASEETTGRTWMPPPAVTLEEAQLALGCPAWNDACAGQIASMTGAGMAIVVEVKAEGAGTSVEVYQVKAGGAVQGAREKAIFDQDKTALDDAKAFLKGVINNRKVGFLAVDTSPPNAELLVDGKRVGNTPWRGPVDAGEHHLDVRMEGRAPVTNRSVTVKPGLTSAESISLDAANPANTTNPQVGNEVRDITQPPPPPAAAAAPGGPDNAVVGWSLAGAGGLVGVVAVVAGAPWAWNLFFNREDCGTGGKDRCLPREVTVAPYGNTYVGRERVTFLSDANVWIASSVAAAGVGGLLIATGIVLATSEPAGAPADAPAAAGR
jgi:hypothetical protein